MGKEAILSVLMFACFDTIFNGFCYFSINFKIVSNVFTYVALFWFK
jgi:hypothetical protein